MDFSITALLGGLLIGLASLALFALNGRIAGISGIAAGLLDKGDERIWRLFFVAGLLLAGVALELNQGWTAELVLRFDLGWYAVAGLLVGFGTRLGGGCTSGHGVCGIGRLSGRSITATVVFMVVAAITVWVVNHSGVIA